MKSLPFLLALIIIGACPLSTSVHAEPGYPPNPHGDAPRYQLTTCTLMNNANQAVPTVMRLDTWTGQTWRLDSVVVMVNGQRTTVSIWSPCEEYGGVLHRMYSEQSGSK